MFSNKKYFKKYFIPNNFFNWIIKMWKIYSYEFLKDNKILEVRPSNKNWTEKDDFDWQLGHLNSK